RAQGRVPGRLPGARPARQRPDAPGGGGVLKARRQEASTERNRPCPPGELRPLFFSSLLPCFWPAAPPPAARPETSPAPKWPATKVARSSGRRTAPAATTPAAPTTTPPADGPWSPSTCACAATSRGRRNGRSPSFSSPNRAALPAEQSPQHLARQPTRRLAPQQRLRVAQDALEWERAAIPKRDAQRPGQR